MSPALKLGLCIRCIHAVAEEARAAEDLGFDYFTCGEHVFFNIDCENSLIALAAAAGATQRIRLMSSITLAPLYPAALLAKQVATLDQASAGRFELGIGIGGEIEAEFAACQVPVKERGARTDEALTVLRRLFTEDDVTFAGRFTTLQCVTLQPKPVQTHLPIWISGRSEAAMRRCANFGDGWLPYMFSPERLQHSVQSITQLMHSRARRKTIQMGVYLPVTVHRDGQIAFDMANQVLSAEYAQDFSKLIGKYTLTGTPENCVARLREYQAAGATTVVLASICPPEYQTQNLQLIAKSVLPALRTT